MFPAVLFPAARASSRRACVRCPARNSSTCQSGMLATSLMTAGPSGMCAPTVSWLLSRTRSRHPTQPGTGVLVSREAEAIQHRCRRSDTPAANEDSSRAAATPGAETAAKSGRGIGSELADGRHGGAAHAQHSRAGGGCPSRYLLGARARRSRGLPSPQPQLAGCENPAIGVPAGAERTRNKRSNRPPPPSYQRSQQPRNPRRRSDHRWRLDRMSTPSVKGGSVKPSSAAGSTARCAVSRTETGCAPRDRPAIHRLTAAAR